MTTKIEDMSSDERERFEKGTLQGGDDERVDVPASEAEQIADERDRRGPAPVLPVNPD
jgi:hypothetical protein